MIHKVLGLTLLEMIIAVIIIAISVTIAVPSFINFLQERRLTMTAEKLFSAITNAKSESIKRNANVFVSFQTGDSWCIGANTGSACTCSNPSSCNLGTIQAEQAQQITLSSTGIASNNFQFEGTRGASNLSSGKITLTLYGQTTSISILISNLGNVQLCSSISGYQTCP